MATVIPRAPHGFAQGIETGTRLGEQVRASENNKLAKQLTLAKIKSAEGVAARQGLLDEQARLQTEVARLGLDTLQKKQPFVDTENRLNLEQAQADLNKTNAEVDELNRKNQGLTLTQDQGRVLGLKMKWAQQWNKANVEGRRSMLKMAENDPHLKSLIPLFKGLIYKPSYKDQAAAIIEDIPEAGRLRILAMLMANNGIEGLLKGTKQAGEDIRTKILSQPAKTVLTSEQKEILGLTTNIVQALLRKVDEALAERGKKPKITVQGETMTLEQFKKSLQNAIDKGYASNMKEAVARLGLSPETLQMLKDAGIISGDR